MGNERSMSFLEHLSELRWRLLRILVAVAVGTGAGLVVAPRLLELLLLPYGSELKVIGPTEGIANFLRIGFVAGMVLALPYALVELWGFVAPALQPREKRYVFVLLPSAFVLFVAGAAFAWLVVIPTAIRFLSQFGSGVFRTEWTSQNYIPFVTSLLLWIGLCFELPLVMFFLAKLGVVDPPRLLRWWRYAVVVIFLASAIITPTVDAFNMSLVSLPMVALYLLGTLVAFLARPTKPKRSADPNAN